jgi:squalene cyclase
LEAVGHEQLGDVLRAAEAAVLRARSTADLIDDLEAAIVAGEYAEATFDVALGQEAEAARRMLLAEVERRDGYRFGLWVTSSEGSIALLRALMGVDPTYD